MKRKTLWVIGLIIAFIVIDVFVLDAFLDKNVDSTAMKAVIEDNCNCENIDGMTFKGLSFRDDILGDSHQYTLTNCEFDDFETAMATLHLKLQENISNFSEADLVRFNYKDTSGDYKLAEIRHNTLTIKN